MRFSLLEVSGTAAERGRAVGESLRSQILGNCEFYEQQFYPLGGASREQIAGMAVRVERIIERFRPALADEIRAMAEAANVDPQRLFALNARTEILNALKTPECTSLYTAASRVLAQTWDWVAAIEPGTVLIHHQLESGLEFLTLTEAGIVGKIGFNTAGLGVCLNILSKPHDLSGVPIHIMARAILETDRYADVPALIEKAGTGKASHLLIADDQGQAMSVEWAGHAVHQSSARAGGYCHSNHYIADSFESPPAPTGNSAERLESANAYLATNPTADAQAVLDFLTRDPQINQTYSPLEHFHDLNIGTVATISMDLSQRSMLVRRGPAVLGYSPEAYRLSPNN